VKKLIEEISNHTFTLPVFVDEFKIPKVLEVKSKHLSNMSNHTLDFEGDYMGFIHLLLTGVLADAKSGILKLGDSNVEISYYVENKDLKGSLPALLWEDENGAHLSVYYVGD